MDHYQKTENGVKALQERNLKLNARQRRLLVLIGTHDFIALSPLMKQKIATSELLEQLETMGLITQVISASHKVDEENVDEYHEKSIFSSFSTLFNTEILRPEAKHDDSMSTKESFPNAQTPSVQHHFTEQEPITKVSDLNTIQADIKYPHDAQSPASPQELESKINFEALHFHDVQHLMIKLLQQYCGLMASQLIQQIQNAQTPKHLKRCQMQWLTILKESKIEPLKLNQCLHQINQSLDHVVTS